MKKYIFIALALLAMTACSKEDFRQEENLVTITATVDSAVTKVTPDTPLTTDDCGVVSFSWQEGDKVLLASSLDASAATQVFTLKAGSIRDDGKTADFIGTPLEDMSGYVTFYAGANTDAAHFESLVAGNAIVLDNAGSNYNVLMTGTGTADGFTMSEFVRTIRLQLKGDGIVLGSVKYFCAGLDAPSTTVNFGTDGLTLSSTAQEVWVPFTSANSGGFTIRFYDTAGSLVMEKSTDTDIVDTDGTLLFPVLSPVAKTGGVLYCSLPDAVAAAADGATVELLVNLRISSPVYVTKSLTLDMKGYSIRAQESQTADFYPIVINNASSGTLTLNIKDGAFRDESSGKCAGAINASATEGHPVALNLTAVDFGLFDSTGYCMESFNVTNSLLYYSVNSSSTLTDVRAKTNKKIILSDSNSGVVTIVSGRYSGTLSAASPSVISITGGLYSADPSAYVATGYHAASSGDTDYPYSVVADET